MCDFKPGDEVVCVVPGNWVKRAPKWMFWSRITPASWTGPRKGDHGVVIQLQIGIHPQSGREIVLIELNRWPGLVFNAAAFRKVQRRDLSAWLKTSVGNTDKLDKRQKAGVRA